MKWKNTKTNKQTNKHMVKCAHPLSKCSEISWRSHIDMHTYTHFYFKILCLEAKKVKLHGWLQNKINYFDELLLTGTWMRSDCHDTEIWCMHINITSHNVERDFLTNHLNQSVSLKVGYNLQSFLFLHVFFLKYY